MSLAQRRILVVDDEESVRGAFRDCLATAIGASDALGDELFGAGAKTEREQVNFDLTLTSQGADAVDAVRRSLVAGEPYSVAFLDMRMPPGIDGAETARRIRALDPLINLVLVTGYSDVDIGEVATQVLPADKLFFIAKPFQVNEIRQQAAALSARWSAESDMIQALRQRNVELQAAVSNAQAAREDALQASMTKSAFLSNVSHELRTPLNAIIGFSELMSGEVFGPLGDARYADYAKEVSMAGISLLSSINNIIDTARLDIGSVQLCYESVDLWMCVEQVAQSMRELANAKHVTLQLTAADQPLPVHADPKRMSQIVLSIMHNAVKFAPESSKIDIVARHTGGAVSVSVSDRGCGIPARVLEATSRPFAHDNNVLARGHGGLGLGLWIAKRLIELHQGQLEIRSMEGAGTTVVLSFPAGSGSSNAK